MQSKNGLDSAQKWTLRFLQVGCTFVAFGVMNKLGWYFQIETGVSVFFPAAAVDVVACMHYGVWGAIGIFLGALVTPWFPDELLWQTATSGLLNVAIGLIPYLVFKYRNELYTDLRDLRSFLVFLLFGTVLNSAFSALVGNIVLAPWTGPGLFSWRGFFMWWVSDFAAALTLGVPLLAFAGGLFDKLRPHREVHSKTTFADALRITLVVVLLGWTSSTVIQNVLAQSVEKTRLQRQDLLSLTSVVLSASERNLEDARRDRQMLRSEDKRSMSPFLVEHDRLVRHLKELAPAISEEMVVRSSEIEELGHAWFAARTEIAQDYEATRLRDTLFIARANLESAGERLWTDYATMSTRMRFASLLMDQILLVVLILVSVNLVRRMSRPLAQLHDAVKAMESEVPFDNEGISTAFVELDGLATAIHDTSERLRENEEQLRLETRRAQEASQAKTDFLAKMSHELRTPLNSIIGFSGLLLRGLDSVQPEKRRRFLENIDHSGRHLLRLINDLLDIVRVEAGKMEFIFESVDLRDLIADVITTTAPILASKGQSVSVEMDEDGLRTLGDEQRLNQVLLNLLFNAHKFSDEGASIVVRGRREGENCVLEVEDYGVGIPEEDQERIFEDFEQSSPAGVNTEGAGLGLALVQKLIEAHGGTVELESELGIGSTFRVRLPFQGSEGS